MKKLLCCLIPLTGMYALAAAQQNQAILKGRILLEDGSPAAGTSIRISIHSQVYLTNSAGQFQISLPANRLVSLAFSRSGYVPVTRTVQLPSGPSEELILQFAAPANELDSVVVTNSTRAFDQPSVIRLDAEKALLNPSPLGGVEGLLKTLVGSNNELSSQYNVRGGSYDENLVYVNDFEIYRPYLVRSGQQEGLSFINPQLTGNIRFYNGGFGTQYGDKMSSVLDIDYRKPTRFGGSLYASLLEQGLHLEGSSRNNKMSFLAGVRNRSNRNLLASQETEGAYVPSSNDAQLLLLYKPATRLELSAFGNYSQSRFTFFPAAAQLTSGVFSPLFAAQLGLNINYQGAERSRWYTRFTGLTLQQNLHSGLKLKWMLSHLDNQEYEQRDLTGEYLFGERDFDRRSSSFGLITNPLGAGVFQQYARNELRVRVSTAQHKGQWQQGIHHFQWGHSIEHQQIHDRLNEWEKNDSAGYTLPLQPGGILQFQKVLKSTQQFSNTRFQGYIQDNFSLGDSTGLQVFAGLRYNYNTLNKELLFSPRAGLSYKPLHWKNAWLFRLSAGRYQQPPFYREMRRYDGTVNSHLKAQKSWQLSLGADNNFTLFGRPARLTTEAYYKYMTDVVPYDIDNVQLRYFGENIAKAYTAGVEARLFGELVRDAESWISIGLMRTRENLNNDFFTTYRNAAGEVIGPNVTDQRPADSSRTGIGNLRRPTDRLITFGIFFQDYLSTNKNFKFYLNAIYGSNLPYNIPGNTRYRNALQINPYLRADLGFSALLWDETRIRRSYAPLKNLKTVWLSFEIFNVIDRSNTISYQLIKDFQNNTYTLPNRLTPRLINLKLAATW